MLLPDVGVNPNRPRRSRSSLDLDRDLEIPRRSSEDSGKVAENPPCGSSPKGGNSGTKIGRSASMNKKVKPKPMIWEHFDVVPNNHLQGRCKACHMTISCKHNTGQFVRHLQLAHMDIFRRYENKIQTEWTKSIVQKNISK